MKKTLTILTVLFIAAGTSFSQQETGSLQDFLAIDVNNMDLSISPNVDFYEYSNGGWIKNNPLPPGYSRWGSFNEVEARNEEILRVIVEDAMTLDQLPGTELQKIGDLYYTAIDSTGRDAMGIDPIKPYLYNVEGIKTQTDMQEQIAVFIMRRIGTVFSIRGAQDDKNSSNVIPQIYQSGLGLPDRDYYFDEGEKYKNIRAEYVKHIARLFELAGYNPVESKKMADVVMAIETRLAKASMTRFERRDPDKTYNKMSLEELKALMPNFNWDAFFVNTGFEMDEDFKNGINVGQPDFMREVNRMLVEVPLDEWKTYMKYKIITSTADLLSSDLVKQDFYFQNTVLRGIDQMRPAWKIALDRVEGSLGEILGKQFVQRTFSPTAKEKVLIMVDNVKDALRQRIKELEWMEPQTKEEAMKKLNAFKPKIGYPDEWRDYSALEIDRSSLLNNVMRANIFYFNRGIDRIGKPVEDEWFMNAFTVNAYYSASRNEIVFPAGILQPPFYSEEFDDAVNYGGIGAVIGHEITHGFDDRGRKYDWEGNLRDWWTEDDARRYTERADKLAEQYNGYIAIDDLTVEGELTLGENIADLGGLKLAYIALMKTLEGKDQPLIDGFTPQQRFFLAWAQTWRQNITDEELRLRLNTDPHSPGRFRTIGPPSNMIEFMEAFGGKPGDPMVREDMIVIW